MEHCRVFIFQSTLVDNPQGLIREVYTDIDHIISGDIRSLYHNNKYPSKPDKQSVIKDFDVPENVGDNYGQRVRGYFVPSESGDYRFFTSCDDMCDLYLSMDDKASHVSKIISQVQLTKYDEFDR